jgi:hypothetical protein
MLPPHAPSQGSISMLSVDRKQEAEIVFNDFTEKYFSSLDPVSACVRHIAFIYLSMKA